MTRIWIISKHWHQNTHTIFREQANRRQPSPLINYSNSFFPSHIYSSSHAETGYLRPVYIYAYTCPRHLKWKYFSFLFQPKQIILLLSLSPPLSLSLSLSHMREKRIYSRMLLSHASDSLSASRLSSSFHGCLKKIYLFLAIYDFNGRKSPFG